MKRRSFLTNAAPVTLMSSVLVSNLFKGCGLRNFWHSDKTEDEFNGRVLVMIQLDGGNDGLNTVIPLDQYENLAKARKNLLIPEKKVLTLHDSAITGLHPAMGPLQKLYNNNNLLIIQGVGCPNPDLSHFKAIDIWHSGSDSSSSVSTGWLGRYLYNKANNRHDDNHADPPAIQVGAALSKALQGPRLNVGMAVRDINNYYDLVPGHYDSPPVPDEDNPLTFIRTMVVESKEYLLKVKAAAAEQNNVSGMYPPPGTNPLADQLRIVARLIGGGMQTRVYMVNLKGFDTHDGQVDTSDTTQGAHADLLSQLSVAIAAFEDDLGLMGKQDNVISMVHSEFGRRIKSNASYGTDHGTSAPVMLIGARVKGGIAGNNPQIPSKVDVNDNLPLQTDFRSVYASLLKNWFGASEADIKSTLFGVYPQISLV